MADDELRLIPAPCPKIELHVHFEATLEPGTMLRLARQNGVALPATDEDGLRELLRFGSFPEFISLWIATTAVLRRADDFRQMVVDYARRAAAQGCLYIEGVISPSERVRRGVKWSEVLGGCCEGMVEARERFGVEVRLTPDLTRDLGPETAEEAVREISRYRDRGVVAVGLGGSEDRFPAQPFKRAFVEAREVGLGSVPHAGEVAGPDSVRVALEVLGADRIRHGVRAAEDPALLEELAARRTVLDVTPVSNVRTGVVASLAEHPLPRLVEAGVLCSISTDDPVLMQTSLEENVAAAAKLGLPPREQFFNALSGALCNPRTADRLRAAGEAYAWESAG